MTHDVLTSDIRDLRLKYKITEGDVLTEGVADAVSEAVTEIIETALFTRLFNRGFGSNLQSLLFEPMSDFNAYILKVDLHGLISRLEPRVSISVRGSSVIPRHDANRYDIYLHMTLEDTGDTFEYSTFLERLS